MRDQLSRDAADRGPRHLWPFLITRGYNVTHKVVVAPDFIRDARLTGLLWDLAGGQPTEPGHGRFRLVRGTSVGDFTVAFRVRLAESSDVGTAGGPPMDNNSRRIPLIEGVIERASHFPLSTSDQPLTEAHRRCLPALRQFWSDDVDWQGPRDCAPITWGGGSDQPLSWEELPVFLPPAPVPEPPAEPPAPQPPAAGKPTERRSGPRGWAIAGTVGAAGAGLIGWALSNRR